MIKANIDNDVEFIPYVLRKQIIAEEKDFFDGLIYMVALKSNGQAYSAWSKHEIVDWRHVIEDVNEIGGEMLYW